MNAPTKKGVSLSAARREAQALVWAHRRRLTIGLALMLAGAFMMARRRRRLLPLQSTSWKHWLQRRRR